MTNWLTLALLAAVTWGVVGFLQKISVSRLPASVLIVWVVVGLTLTIPFFLPFWTDGRQQLMDHPDMIAIGVVSGLFNGAGAWFLFRSLELGGKASIAIPLTAMYPLITVALSVAFLSEQLAPHQWGGVALASFGAALLSYEKSAG